MLYNNFFSVTHLENNGEKITASVNINGDHQILQGHFPENPVVPGVCLIQMIKEIVEKVHSTSLVITQSDEIKFLNMITPIMFENLFIDIVKRVNSSDYSYQAIVYKQEITFLKIKIDFKQE